MEHTLHPPHLEVLGPHPGGNALEDNVEMLKYLRQLPLEPMDGRYKYNMCVPLKSVHTPYSTTSASGLVQYEQCGSDFG